MQQHLVPASEILEFSPNLTFTHYMYDGTIDDFELFSVEAPPKTRADTEHRPIRTDSLPSYVVQEVKSNQSKATSNLAIHHNDLTSLFKVGLFAAFHLCHLLSGIIKGPGHPAGSAESKKFYSETRIELTWTSSFAELDDNQRNLTRIHL
ncbi:MAG: hypothetical protein Q9177_003571 [Variospora cf. flavescens]